MPRNSFARIVLVAAAIAGSMLLWDAVGSADDWKFIPGWLLEWLSISAVAGAALVVLAIRRKQKGFIDRASSQTIADLPATVGHLPRFRRFPASPPPSFLSPANFAMYFALFLMCIMFVFMVLRTPQTPHGLRIRVNTRSASSAFFGPTSETLAVYADKDGKFYVNGTIVEPAQLEAKLSKEIRRRTTPLVYVEANNDIEFRRVIFVFDAIKGAGGEPIWITPLLRKQWQDAENKTTSGRAPQINLSTH